MRSLFAIIVAGGMALGLSAPAKGQVAVTVGNPVWGGYAHNPWYGLGPGYGAWPSYYGTGTGFGYSSAYVAPGTTSFYSSGYSGLATPLGSAYSYSPFGSAYYGSYGFPVYGYGTSWAPVYGTYGAVWRRPGLLGRLIGGRRAYWW